jgi:hypothetical protein
MRIAQERGHECVSGDIGLFDEGGSSHQTPSLTVSEPPPSGSAPSCLGSLTPQRLKCCAHLRASDNLLQALRLAP